MKPRPAKEGQGALEVIEEAVHLLRSAPLFVWGLYYAGAVPFVLMALFFWSDMSRGALAYERCGVLSLALAALYLWMRSWQAAFCLALQARLGSAPFVLPFSRLLRIIGVQCRWAPWSLAGLFLSTLAVLPYAWAMAFHQNLAAMTLREDQPSARRARELGRLWPRQNHILLAVLALFRFFVFLNIASLLVVAPSLLKTLLGISTPLTQHAFWFLNTTFLAVVAGLAYLAVDPLIKAVYVCRCYDGDARVNGQDLRLEARRLAVPRAARLAVALGAWLAVSAWTPADQLSLVALPCEGLAWTNAAASLEVAQLDEAISRVMTRPEYTWRAPRDLKAVQDRMQGGVFYRFMDSISRTGKSLFKSVARQFRKIGRWLERWMRGRHKADASERAMADFSLWLKGLAWLLIVVVSVVGGVAGWRLFKRRKPSLGVALTPVVEAPDIHDEQVLASQWPEEEWLNLAARLRAEGDHRGALRALFLALLACLCRGRLIEVARSKSNLDYYREVVRRARRAQEVPPVFAEAIGLYEWSWYGLHPVVPESLERAEESLAFIRRKVEELGS